MTKKLYSTLLVILSLTALCACGQKKAEISLIITPEGVAPFMLGKVIPKTLEGYEIKTETFHAGEGIYDVRRIISQNGEQLLIVEGEEIASQIWICSDKFRTEKGVGIGSTLKQLAEVYPNYYLSYSQLTDWFSFSPSSMDIGFLLGSGENYIGEKDLYVGDGVTLELSEFLPGTKVTEIRLY